MATGYYDQDFEPWVAGIRRIGTMIMQQPALRAAAQDRAMDQQLTGARIAGEQSQAGLADARTAEFVQKGKLVTALEESAAQAQADLAAGRTDTPAVRAFVSASSALTGLNSDDIAQNMRKGIGTMLAVQGKGREAATVDDPNAAFKTTEDNASRERIAGDRAMSVSPGGAVWQGGKVVYERPSAANEEYETVTEVTPGTEGSPAIPAKFGLLGRKVADAIPAVPPTPEKRVTTRRKLGSAVTQATNVPFAEQTMEGDEPEGPAADAAEPTTQPAAAPQSDGNRQRLIAEANDAIKRGAPREKVLARLREKYGIIVQ